MVLKFQNAFIEGRQILDVMFIGNEVIDPMLRRNSCSVLCRLDINKTYDNVN